jgi:hypothetical protein
VQRPWPGRIAVDGNYDCVLKTDGSVGDRKAYDPRIWNRPAEAAMAQRTVEACRQLGLVGRTRHGRGTHVAAASAASKRARVSRKPA